jgi:hypothetical protein|tara:strand:+ start:1174 stop:1341 length:168 start_codon:yes stop_codon:yes gene_type:complete
MKKRKKKNKMYVVLSKSKNYRYGVFPFDEDGLENAKNFVKEMEVLRSEKLYIVEK